MDTQAFNSFLASLNASKSTPTINFNTLNVSKSAQKLLTKNYPMLAKAHVSKKVVDAYHTNGAFKAKMDSVLKELAIALVDVIE